MDTQDEKKDLRLEEALAKLEETASRMEQENLPLDEMMKLYKEGISLSKRCEELLDGAEKEIEVLEQENSEL